MQTYRMSLTRIDEHDDESTVLVIEGTGEMIGAALPLVGQLTGSDTSTPAISAADRAQAFMERDAARAAAESNGDAQIVAANQSIDETVGGDAPKRKRRTKAEIEADKLAAEQAATATPAPAAAPFPITPPPMAPPAGWSPFGQPSASLPS